MLAKAGVSWHAGREANWVYGETYNGIREPGTGGHVWPKPVDPYKVPGDPTSGLLPRITTDPGVPGEGDQKIQAFCFRMRLTKDNPLPFPKPAGYDETECELLARLFETGADPFIQFSIDTNNHHLFRGGNFIDYKGGNYDWPNADWKERERIFQAHANYQIGVMWFLTHSDRIPEPYRSELQKWGLPRDEYQDTGGWTHQLYIREGRRMVSDYVMTQKNCQGVEVPKDSIGLASYNMDSHHCQMTVVNGVVVNEGNVEVPVEPYPISYRALTPKRAECTNLLVPVALSSTHIAFGSIRMEPVFMLLGQSAATAAVMAMDKNVPVQDVDYEKLRTRLLADGQILEYTGPPRHRGRGQAGIDPKTLEGLVIDNDKAELVGPWSENNVTHPRVGETYLHDGNEAKGKCKARYAFKLEMPGRYEVRLSWPTNSNRATNVPVTIQGVDGQTKTVTVNQKTERKAGESFTSLGEFEFGKEGVIEISNEGTNGYVIADAVQLLPEKKQTAQKPAPNAPNILLILADDLGYGELGCQGNREIPTPHIDSLAKNGVRFTNGYVTASFCSPSRAALMTGKYQTRFGYELNPVGKHNLDPKAGLPLGEATLADHLKSQGYATALIGKWHLGGTEPYHPLNRGFEEFYGFLHEGHFYVPRPDAGVLSFLRKKELPAGNVDRWQQGNITYSSHMVTDEPPYDQHNPILRGREEVPEPDYLTDAFTREAVRFLRTPREKPFFLYLAYNAVHSPLQSQMEDMKPFESLDIHRRIFAGMLANLDRNIGKILETLREQHLEENTLIFFLSDNGGPTKELTSSNRPLNGGKGNLYDGGIRVPFLMQWKGHLPQGVEYPQPVISTDIFATAMAVSGARDVNSSTTDGVNLLPFVSGTSAGKPHQMLYWRMRNNAALRQDDWKIVRNSGPGKLSPEFELYNLKDDVGETRNLAKSHPEPLHKLTALWEQLDRQMIAPVWKPEK